MEDLTGQVDTFDSITALEWNNFQQEWKNFVTSFMTMSVGDLDQMRKATTAVSVQGQWLASSGGTIAYTLAMNAGIIAPPAYAGGQVFQFRPNVNNTVGAVTVNVGSLGAKSLTREDGSALQAADLSTTRDAVIRYTGTQFYLLNSSLAAGAADLPNRYIAGLTMGRNAAEVTTQHRDIEVQVGSCRDEANTMNLVLGAVMVKRFDAGFAFGTVAGGYGSAAAAAVGTWYRFFAIGNSATGGTDFGWDISSTATTLLADANTAAGGGVAWDSYRQIGWTRTTDAGASELVPFTHDPSDPSTIMWVDGEPLDDHIGGGGGLASATTAQLTYTTSYAPPSSTLMSRWWAYTKQNSGTNQMAGIIHSIPQRDTTPTANVNHVKNDAPGASAGSGVTPITATNQDLLGETEVAVDSSQQFNARWFISGNGGAYIYDRPRGFRWER